MAVFPHLDTQAASTHAAALCFLQKPNHLIRCHDSRSQLRKRCDAATSLPQRSIIPAGSGRSFICSGQFFHRFCCVPCHWAYWALYLRPRSAFIASLRRRFVKGSAASRRLKAIGGPFGTCCGKRRRSATRQKARSLSAKRSTTRLFPHGAPAARLP
jgi:hypothetical protein